MTRTDVSQAEARLVRATADRIGAEGALAATRATFRNVVGIVPGVLVRPPLPQELPASLGEANEIATNNNPNVTAVAFQERSALNSGFLQRRLVCRSDHYQTLATKPSDAVH